MWRPFQRRRPRSPAVAPRDPAARELALRADELFAEQQLESTLLLSGAEHYANAVEHVATEEEGRAVCEMVARGYAVRVTEEERGTAVPVPTELAESGDPIVTAARLAQDDRGGAARLLALGEPAWRELAAWGRCAAEAASATRQQAAGGRSRPALVDSERAFAFGYALRCCEQRTPAALELFELGNPRPLSLHALLRGADALLERGPGLYAVRDTEVALAAGVVHGLAGEDAPKPLKDDLADAARGGYALRRAEEDAGFGPARDAALRDWLVATEARHAGLLHWEAMQAAAWAMEGGEPPEPAGHPERDAALARVAEAVGIGDALRAARFGYALRCAEASLPLDPERLLHDG